MDAVVDVLGLKMTAMQGDAAMKLSSQIAGGVAGILSLPLMGIAAVLLEQGDGDLREGGFPWALATVAVLLLVCTNGIRIRHEVNSGLLLKAGVQLIMLGLVGMLVLFGGIAISGLFGLDEPPGILGYGVLIVGVLAAAGLPCGLFILGVSIIRGNIWPTWYGVVPITIAGLNPVAMIAMGIAEGAVENVIANVWMMLFGLGWAAVGLALWRSNAIRA